MINNIIFFILIKNLSILKLNYNNFVFKKNLTLNLNNLFISNFFNQKNKTNSVLFGNLINFYFFHFKNFFFLNNYVNKIYLLNYLSNTFNYNYLHNNYIIFIKNFNNIFINKKIKKIKNSFYKNPLFSDYNIFLKNFDYKLFFNLKINKKFKSLIRILSYIEFSFLFKKPSSNGFNNEYVNFFLKNLKFKKKATKIFFFSNLKFFSSNLKNLTKINFDVLKDFKDELNFYVNVNNYEIIEKNEFEIESILYIYDNFLNKNNKKLFYYNIFSNFLYNEKFKKVNFKFNNFYTIFFYNIFLFKFNVTKKDKSLNIFKNFEIKKFNNNIKNILKIFFFINDFFNDNSNENFLINVNNFYYNITSNKFFVNNLTSLEISENYFLKLKNSDVFNNKKIGIKIFNNYYPIFFLDKRGSEKLFSKFKFSLTINYLNYMQTAGLNFLEYFFKKKFFLKISNNFFKICPDFNYLSQMYEEYKNYKPKYMKNYFISDFLELLWYSFLFKDLKLVSNWISNFMETINFKNHKKFLQFFQNLVKKHSSVFLNILKIDGFFFDIRGKVGVSGSSKKRHITFKIGKLNKSKKLSKIAFNQNLVRTYSGVLGLTYIISY